MPKEIDNKNYRVLARKYRPKAFTDLVGQEVLVRTLAQAFESGRIAHAFLLTGVRGIGKTTTARLIARAVNCTMSDKPTIEPCGDCDACKAIAEDRHVDVLEMDAASRTGVDDIRGLIDGIRYAPVSGRYKVYIIDEVHMLSKNAFNALLKTLEEPPSSVIFIFATTEVRKLPLTVLSRCQRFDLRRVEPDLLSLHLNKISKNENVKTELSSLAIISRAAQGSVRDALSLLDQAILSGKGKVTEEIVQEMLGLSDRGRILDLFEFLLEGRVTDALQNLREQFSLGADPIILLEELLDLTHWITRIKAISNIVDADVRTKADQKRGVKIAEKVSMPVLTRTWQMLLKGSTEIQVAPDPMAALEMVIVRLTFAADLPSPAEIIGKISDSSQGQGTPNGIKKSQSMSKAYSEIQTNNQSSLNGPNARKAEIVFHKQTEDLLSNSIVLRDFQSLVKMAAEKREPRMHAELINNVRLVHFEEGSIEINLVEASSPDFANRLRKKLQDWTGSDWSVVLSKMSGEPTMREVQDAKREKQIAQAADDPAVRAVLDTFPGSEISEVKKAPLDAGLLSNLEEESSEI